VTAGFTGTARLEKGGELTPRGAETRAKLIDATVAVVREAGYARATTRAIAEAAGVAEGTIYRHFADKQQLFFAAILERHQVIVEWVTRLPELAGTGTVRDNLTESLTRLSELRSDLLPLELSVMADPDLAREHRRGLTASDPLGPLPGPPSSIAAYLAAEQRLGRIRADVEPVQSAIILLATLFGIAMVPRPPDVALGVGGDLIGPAVALLLSGLEPRGG